MDQSTTKIFTSGNSQAVRIPKKYRFDCDEVMISQRGDELVLTPIRTSWLEFFAQAPQTPHEFMEFDRDDQPQQRDLF